MLILIVLPLQVLISIITLAPVQYLVSCSLATTSMVRSTVVVATAAIGVLRRPPILLTPAICTSLVAASIQPITTVDATGLASGASSRGSSSLAVRFLLPHLS